MFFEKVLLAGALAFAFCNESAAQSANPPVANVQTCTLAAAALPSASLMGGAVLKADAANTGTIYVGPATVTATTGYPLKAGEAMSYGVTNLGLISMICSNTTDVLHFSGN